jgi:hypothetical protein
MNSDLVYKKKYLKYKSKYTALQREMNVQEGGISFSSIKPANIKSGIYLFFVTNSQDYDNLKDEMGLPKEVYLRDSGAEISNKLGSSCYYAERKMDVTGIIGSPFKLSRNIEVQSLELKQCVTGTPNVINGTQFTGRTSSLIMVEEIAKIVKQQIPYLSFYFIVDYNSTKSNRISCLYPIASAPQASAPSIQNDTPLQ